MIQTRFISGAYPSDTQTSASNISSYVCRFLQESGALCFHTHCRIVSTTCLPAANYGHMNEALLATDIIDTKVPHHGSNMTLSNLQCFAFNTLFFVGNLSCVSCKQSGMGFLIWSELYVILGGAPNILF